MLYIAVAGTTICQNPPVPAEVMAREMNLESGFAPLLGVWRPSSNCTYN